MEWNSGMEYWNGGMLQSAYLIKIIQHIIQLGCLDLVDLWNGNSYTGILTHVPTLASMFYIAPIVPIQMQESIACISVMQLKVDVAALY